MRFWCHYCEDVFESEPDSDLYEQANCPTCDGGCLTFETEYEDARTQLSQGAIVGSLLSSVLGMLFSGLGLAARAAVARSSTPAILEFAAKTHYRRPMIVTLASLEEATRAHEKLSERDIDCRIAETAEGYCIHVDEDDETRARRIVERWLLTRPNQL